MPSIDQLIRRLLPHGTTAPGRPSWHKCPPWPPDAFAVAATLVEESSAYASYHYGGTARPKPPFNRTYRQRVLRAAKTWRNRGEVPARAQECWSVVVAAGHCDVSAEPTVPSGDWRNAAIELLAISDEASSGIGFLSKGSSPIAELVFLAQRGLVKGRRGRPSMTSAGTRLHVPVSVCHMVPPSEACVQPKTRTSQVGCTLRAFSHHLALLPRASVVLTRWHFAQPGRRPAVGPLNLLVVPYPYAIEGEAFRAGKPLSDDEGLASRFTLHQRWLNRIAEHPEDRAKAIADELIVPLARLARSEVGQIHGVVLPETALDHATAVALGQRFLGSEHLHPDQLEFFVSGILAPAKSRGAGPRNQAYVVRYQGRGLWHWQQSKHHRWRIDDDQVRRYQLGHALDPVRRWWEDIDVSGREVNFTVFRPGAALAVLVCEDLARIDPVQPVLRAVGPNLVIALLLDGPQLERRWPGRYATVLADDPGCAVLTVTSLGMVRRSILPGAEEPRQVALWKDSSGKASELVLPRGHHALVLSLSSSRQVNCTLDGRSDRCSTVQLSLGGVRAIALDRPARWIDPAG